MTTVHVTGTWVTTANHERRREEPDPVGERPRDQEDERRRDRFHFRAEPALQQLVRRDQLAAEVGRDED